MRRVDVLIIGNGVLGLLLADELARQDAGTVAVVGPHRRDLGAAPAVGAVLGSFGDITADTLASAAGRARFALSLAARDRWPDLLRRLGVPHTADDTYVLHHDEPAFAAMAEALGRHDAKFTEVDPGTVPGDRAGAHRRALTAVHLEDEGAVDGRRLLAALATHLGRSGVDLVDRRVTELLTSRGAVYGARLGDGETIEAGAVVVAAGADSRSLTAGVLSETMTMPVYAARGVAVAARRTTGASLTSVVRTPGLHLVPVGGGHEHLGARLDVATTTTSAPALSGVGSLIADATADLDTAIAGHELAGVRTGHQPVSLDGFPLIGWTHRPGLYLLTGTHRDGLTCGPVLATHAARELLGSPGILDPTFTPARAPIGVRTVRESISAYVAHSLAAHPGAPAAPFENRASALYDRLGTDYGLAPELVTYALSAPSHAHGLARYFRGNHR